MRNLISDARITTCGDLIEKVEADRPATRSPPLVLLVDGVNPDGNDMPKGDGALVHRPGRAAEPLAGILDRLKSLPSVQEVHVVCPGEPGRVQLGALELSIERLFRDERVREELCAIGRCLGGEGAIVLGGSNAGFGETGAVLLQALANLSGVEVSALVRCRPQPPAVQPDVRPPRWRRSRANASRRC